MEDRYLFRAKRKDDGQWIKGTVLFHDADAATIFSQHPADGSLQGFEVEPSTVCQCTGLKDKNGKIIWENDIVRVTTNSGSTICRCAFADIVAQFQLWQEHTIKKTPTVLNLGNYECEVIGNIFDNKELSESEGRYDRE